MNPFSALHRVNGANSAVAALLVMLGILAYADVGGPLVIIGGLVVALALLAYHRLRTPDRR